MSVSLFVALTLSVVTFSAYGSRASNGHLTNKREPHAKFGLMAVNCSLDSKTSDMLTLASLAVLGSRQYRGKEEFHVLAIMDMWSNVPTLASELAEADVSLTGKIETDPDKNSALILSWGSPTTLCSPTYKCVANGFDRKRQPVSVVSELNLGHMIRTKCRNKMDIMTSEVQRLTEVVEVTARSSEEILEQGQGRDEKLRELESIVRQVQLNTRVLAITATIDKSKFDVSQVYRDRMYLLSRTVQEFNIERDNRDCVAQGGYLVEINDDGESEFVQRFAQTLGGTHFFMTGMNDIEKEGHFVFYNSKEPIPRIAWSRGEPNNVGEEDCVQFFHAGTGYNDIRCNTAGKFICEVPLR